MPDLSCKPRASHVTHRVRKLSPVHRWSDAKLARVWFGRAWIVAHLARYLFALLLLRLGPAQGAGWAPSHAHVAYLAGTFIWVWQMHTIAIPMLHQTILVMGRCVEMSIHHPLSVSPPVDTVYTRVTFVTATLAGFAVGAWLESHDRREHVASTRFSPQPTARLNLQPSLPPMHALTLRFIDADLEARFLEQLETSHLGLAVQVMLLLAATVSSPATAHLTVGIAVQLGLRVVGSPVPYRMQMAALCFVLPAVAVGEYARQTALSSLSVVFMCLFFASSPSLSFLTLRVRFGHHASYMVVGILACLGIGFVIDRTYLYFAVSLLCGALIERVFQNELRVDFARTASGSGNPSAVSVRVSLSSLTLRFDDAATENAYLLETWRSVTSKTLLIGLLATAAMVATTVEHIHGTSFDAADSYIPESQWRLLILGGTPLLVVSWSMRASNFTTRAHQIFVAVAVLVNVSRLARSTSSCSPSPRAAPPTSSSSTRTSAKTCSAPSSRRRRAPAASRA